MILLFKLILITFIIVMGLKIAMSKGMLLERFGDWFETKIDEGHKVYDLFYCQWCMSTLVSLVAYAFAFGLKLLPFEWNWQLIIRWPLVVMGGSFICGNTWNLYEMVNRIKDKNEEEMFYYKRLNDKEEPISG